MTDDATLPASRIVDASDDGIVAFDRSLRVTLWNPAMEGIARASAAGAVGRPLAELPPFADSTELLALARSASSGATTSILLELGGRHLRVSSAPLSGNDGSIAGGFVSIRDLTDFHDARDRLAATEARLRAIVDHAPVLLWMTGTDALCTFFNRRWLEFTGRFLERELGNGWAEGVHPEDFQECMDIFLEAFVRREEFRLEYRLRRSDRAYRWVLDTGVPFFGVGGDFEGYVGTCVDITAIKEARDDLDRKVRERTAELEAFSYSVSHDLRAPLRHVDGFSQALLEEYSDRLDDRGREYVERVRRGARRMEQLIEDLLNLSRLGRAELRLQEVDLTELATRVAATVRERYRDREIELVLEPGLSAFGDPALLQVALENLFENAWKFTAKSASPKVELGSMESGGHRTFFVRDTGVGFDMLWAPKLFAPFQRLHSEADFPGTGIGLAMVQRIVRRLGGRVWAESSVGKGATFYFTLAPLSTDDARRESHAT